VSCIFDRHPLSFEEEDNIMDHTIAAIATAPGEGGIGIIRISGFDSFSILKKMFRYRSGKMISYPEPRRMIYGNILNLSDESDSSSVIDECMSVYMKAPHTYTGEDVVEIQCHGSIVSLRRILAQVLDCGAELAEKGEFTKRAFLNGRIDLSQAEAVIDIVKAKSDTGLDSAVSQLQGVLSLRIREIRKNIADMLADIVAHIEYPEEDLEELTYADILNKLSIIKSEIKKIADTADTGRVFRDGLKVAIAGRPNVGKSSLMNAVLCEERAIVTDIPGTTRDTIEEYAAIGGIPIRIIDTAGIRQTDDTIEKIGIEKSRSSIYHADIVLIMIDGSSEISDEDINIFSSVTDKKTIFIINKSDLRCIVDEDMLKRCIEKSSPWLAGSAVISMSAKSGEGIDTLKDEIKRIVYNGEASAQDEVMITNVRHEQLLKNSLSLLDDAEEMLINGEALDFPESDIREAWMTLGEITGDAVTDDIVNEVFSRFCLGK
jgi:tRNA modification GTPase